MRDIVLTLIFLVPLVPALTRPWLGVLLWVWFSYMNPHRLCYGFAYWFPYAQISAIIIFISLFLSQEPIRWPITKETALNFLFVIWMNITTLFAINQDLAWPEWSQVMKIQLMAFVTILAIRRREHLEMMIWVIVGSLGFYALKGSVFMVTGGTGHVMGPPRSFIADNNDLAVAFVMALPLMRYLQTHSERRWVRLGLTVGMICTAIGVIGSYSRGGALALAAVLVMTWLKGRNRLAVGLFLVIAIPIGYHLLPARWFERMDTIQNYQQDKSALGRLNAWHFAMNVVKHRPITGGGFRVFTPNLFLIYAPNPIDYHEAHSIYFKILAEHGIPGLILFVSLGLVTWRTASQIRHRARELPQMQWAADLVSMVQVALIGYGVGGAFGNLCYFDLPYNMIGIVVICKLLMDEAEWEQGSAAGSADDSGSEMAPGVPTYA